MNTEHLLGTRHCAVYVREGVGGCQGCGVGQGEISHSIFPNVMEPSLTVAPPSLSIYS